MKRIQKFAAVNLVAALLGAGIPAMAQERYGVSHQDGGRCQDVDHHWRDRRDNGYYDRNEGGYDRRAGYGYEGRGYSDNHRDGYYNDRDGYYNDRYYNDGYDHRTHHGRDAAVVIGTTAAGAVIGAAAGHGKGSLIGAAIGGVTGIAIDAAKDHHRRY